MSAGLLALFLFILLALGFADKNWLNTPDKIWSRSPGSNNVERFSPRVPVLPSSASDFPRIKQKAVSFETAFSCARRVIFPGRRQSPLPI